MAAALKEVYTRKYINALAMAFVDLPCGFDQQQFVSMVFDDEWPKRELKQRMAHISACLHTVLSLPYKEAIDCLTAIAHNFGDLQALIFPEFVASYGLEDWDLSITAMAYFTSFSSSEFAVRPFIVQDQPAMMAQMYRWSEDENHHVRRLACEGCRPRLPWAMALPAFKKQPAAIMPIIETLKKDPSEYVRRSVSNNLNDIAKDNPQTVLAWSEKNLGHSLETDWIIKRGCRTLLKQAHPQALALFSYLPADQISVDQLAVSMDSLAIGEAFNFTFRAQSTQSSLGLLRVEYGIDFVKANGKLSRKIFQLADSDHSDATRIFSRKHSFRQMSTRKHYPGMHRLAILINGEEKASLPFELL